jgi:hypothetical protein
VAELTSGLAGSNSALNCICLSQVRRSHCYLSISGFLVRLWKSWGLAQLTVTPTDVAVFQRAWISLLFRPQWWPLVHFKSFCLPAYLEVTCTGPKQELQHRALKFYGTEAQVSLHSDSPGVQFSGGRESLKVQQASGARGHCWPPCPSPDFVSQGRHISLKKLPLTVLTRKTLTEPCSCVQDIAMPAPIA